MSSRFESVKSMPSYTEYKTAAASPVGIICDHMKIFLANQECYACYQASPLHLNANLTDHQKAIVERFFAAVRQTFPQQFTSK